MWGGPLGYSQGRPGLQTASCRLGGGLPWNRQRCIVSPWPCGAGAAWGGRTEGSGRAIRPHVCCFDSGGSASTQGVFSSHRPMTCKMEIVQLEDTSRKDKYHFMMVVIVVNQRCIDMLSFKKNYRFFTQFSNPFSQIFSFLLPAINLGNTQHTTRVLQIWHNEVLPKKMQVQVSG